MSWLGRILGIARKVTPDRAGALLSLVERIAKHATDKNAFRKALIDAAEAGDLDFVFDDLEAANAKADDYIQNG